jgi:protein disulfide-isomerase A6
MAPEYAKTANKLHPLIPTYAVDCDDEKNKPLCAEQQVQGFPTVKVRVSYPVYILLLTSTCLVIP